MIDRWKPGMPACASTPEDDGPNFESPTIFNTINPHNRRLREAAAFDKVSRETAAFHERKARAYGVDHPQGLAHFKASKVYRQREAAGRLQEMFEKGGELGQLPPKAIMKVNHAAMAFHKKAAEKAGLDSDEGHAHVAALEHHMDIHNKAKQQHQQQKAQKQQMMQAATSGISGKQAPVPVPKKSEQPNEDIRQNLPSQPLSKLQQRRRETAGAHAGMIKASRKRQREGGRGPYDDMDCTEPSKVSKQLQKGPGLKWRGTQPQPARIGPLAAKPRVHGGTREAGGSSSNYVGQRYDKSHPEGFVSSEYAGMKNGVNESNRSKRNVGKKIAKRSLESRREDNRDLDVADGPRRIDLSNFYKKPERKEGWHGGSYSPPTARADTAESTGIVIKEF